MPLGHDCVCAVLTHLYSGMLMARFVAPLALATVSCSVVVLMLHTVGHVPAAGCAVSHSVGAYELRGEVQRVSRS